MIQRPSPIILVSNFKFSTKHMMLLFECWIFEVRRLILHSEDWWRNNDVIHLCVPQSTHTFDDLSLPIVETFRQLCLVLYTIGNFLVSHLLLYFCWTALHDCVIQNKESNNLCLHGYWICSTDVFVSSTTI